MGYSGDTFLRLNHCRLHLHVLILSDVVTGDGKCIRLDALCTGNHQWCYSSLFKHWPNTKPTRSDWDLWRSVLQGYARHRQLEIFPLGAWYSFSHCASRWWYSHSTSLLYHKSLGQWNKCFSLRGSPVRPGTTFTWAAPLDQQLDLFQATVHVAADGMVVFEGAAPSSPPPALYLTGNSWSIELQACWLLRHSSFPMNLPPFQLDRPWRL
eukprot:1957564-Ditylum_brightwellii.AAC.1